MLSATVAFLRAASRAAGLDTRVATSNSSFARLRQSQTVLSAATSAFLFAICIGLPAAAADWFDLWVRCFVRETKCS